MASLSKLTGWANESNVFNENAEERPSDAIFFVAVTPIHFICRHIYLSFFKQVSCLAYECIIGNSFFV